MDKKLSFNNMTQEEIFWKFDVDENILDEMTRQKIDLNWKNEYGETLLDIASNFCDSTEVIKRLIKEGVKLTSFTNAAQMGSFEVVKILMENFKEDLNEELKSPDLYRFVALNTDFNAIKLFIEIGPDISCIIDDKGNRLIDHIKKYNSESEEILSKVNELETNI